jgi:hypothetical protein
MLMPTAGTVSDRRYAHPINLPVIAMAIACWALIALVVLLIV